MSGGGVVGVDGSSSTRHVFPQVKFNSKTSKYLGCVSSIFFIKKSALYADTRARIYRVREELTAEANNVDLKAVENGTASRPMFDDDRVERVIYFDYYIKKRRDTEKRKIIKERTERTKAREIKTLIRAGEKGEPPEPGEKIMFQLLNTTKEDAEDSVRFEGRVSEVWHGTMTLEDEVFDQVSTFNDNVGLVKIDVVNYNQYRNSLCLPPVKKRQKIEKTFAA
jgi:hypothetical protein